jgi:hypothetical protein
MTETEQNSEQVRRMPFWSKLGMLICAGWALAGLSVYALDEADIWRPAATPVADFFEQNVTKPPEGLDKDIEAARKEYEDFKAIVDLRAGAPESLKEKGLQHVRFGEYDDAEMISNLIQQIRELEKDYQPELDSLRKNLEEKESIAARARDNAELLALLTHVGGGVLLGMLFLVGGFSTRK